MSDSTRALARSSTLWPRYPLWPSAPFWLLVAFWAVQGKLRWDHMALALLATLLAYWSDVDQAPVPRHLAASAWWASCTTRCGS